MVPPIYPDLGKLARDLFYRGYHPGIWQLECRTKSNAGFEFFTTGMANQEVSKVTGSLQSKYKIEDYNVTLTERWNTDNWLYGEIMQRDQLAEGLMMALEAKYQPISGDKEGKFKLGYARDWFNFLSDINFDTNGPLINASLVLGHKDFLGGLGCSFDTGGGKLAGWKAALGWANDNFVLHGELMDGKNWLASAYCVASEKIDCGLELTKGGPPGGVRVQDIEDDEDQRAGGDIKVGVGIIYHLDEDALIRAKIDNNVEVGLGYQQKLRDGVTFSISVLLEGKQLKDGNHKIGIGFAMDC